jgi:hypothetical protein
LADRWLGFASRTHARTHVVLLIDHDHVRVVDAATGELLRDLTIDTSRDYQPTGRPPGRTQPTEMRVQPSGMSCEITRRPRQDSNLRHTV